MIYMQLVVLNRCIYFCITELTQACQRRDLESLKKAIARAKEVNYEHQLDLQLALANRLRDQLERIEKLRHSVLNLDSKTIAEIKTYSNPPDGVHQSMMATFILLGNTPKEVRVGISRSTKRCYICPFNSVTKRIWLISCFIR